MEATEKTGTLRTNHHQKVKLKAPILQTWTKTENPKQLCKGTFVLLAFLVLFATVNFYNSGILSYIPVHYPKEMNMNFSFMFYLKSMIPEHLGLQNNSTYNATSQELVKAEPMVILIWTFFYFLKPFGLTEKIKNSNITCGHYTCLTTTERSKYKTSDAIIFRLRSMSLTDMPKTRYPNQRWILQNIESPHHSYPGAGSFSQVEGLFNWTMTYHKQFSDIWLPYGTYYKLKTPLSDAVVDKVVANRTTVPSVLWQASNCAPEHRKNIARLLQRTSLKVDIFGSCMGSDPCKRDGVCTEKLWRKYRFYLSFENSHCR